MKVPSRLAIQSSESIFSFVARLQKLAGLPSESDMCQLLCGKDRIRVHPFLPSQLALLGESINIEAEDLILNHTLFPLFAFFNPSGAAKLKLAMLYSDQSVTSLAGIPHARIPLTFAHKWCPTCVQTSITLRGFPVLRIEHQIPGVISCSLHRCNLHMISAGDMGLDRHLKLIFPKVSAQLATDFAYKFAVFTHAVLEICKHNYAMDLLALYRKHLQFKGYVTDCGYLRINKLQNDFSTVYDCAPIESIAADFLRQVDFLGPLLRTKTSYPAHPLKHLLFTFWLFDQDAQKFIQPVNLPIAQKPNLIPKEDQGAGILKLLTQGKSMHQIEILTGRSRCFIRRIAELNNVEHRSNSLIYPEETKRAVQMKALAGVNRMKIADDLGVGIGYVEQVICNTPFLSEWRKHLSHQMKIKNAIQVILKIVQDHPNWCRTQVRMAAKAEYYLLYMHDKTVLNNCLPKPKKPKPPKCK